MTLADVQAKIARISATISRRRNRVLSDDPGNVACRKWYQRERARKTRQRAFIAARLAESVARNDRDLNGPS